MKSLLRSFLVMALALGVSVASTSAYFTANVVATDNLVTTGTMVMYVGTNSSPNGDATGKWVGYADKNGYNSLSTFEPITDIQPGETRSFYTAVANYGSLPFRYQATVNGAWDNTSLSGMMSVSNVYRYATGNCEGNAYCEDIYYWLTNAGYTNVSAGAGAQTISGGYFGGDSADYELSNLQFTVYQVDLQLDPSAGNSYQGETYRYTLSVDGKQTTPGSTF